MSEEQSFPIGSKVRVRNFPSATMQAAPFDWNGLVGTIKRADKVGVASSEKRAIYAYEVFFENVKVPFAVKNPATQKIDKGYKTSNAQNYFEEIFLERVYDSNPAV